MTKRTTLIPLDGSSRSRQVLKHIEKLCDPSQDQLVLLRVTPVPPGVVLVPHGAAMHRAWPPLHTDLVPDPGDGPKIYTQQLMESKRSDLLNDLGLEARTLRQAGFAVVCDVRFGEPTEEIIGAAEKHRADRIAMATHGRSGLRRMLMGSVAEAVLRRSNTPVLMLRSVPSLVTGKKTLSEPVRTA